MTMDVENVCHVNAESLVPANAIAGTTFPDNNTTTSIHQTIGSPFQ